MDQPRKVGNPDRGHLKRENEYFPVPVYKTPGVDKAGRVFIWTPLRLRKSGRIP